MLYRDLAHIDIGIVYTVCERPDLARVEGEELPFAFQALRHTGNDIRIDDEEIRPSFDRERELMVTSDIEVRSPPISRLALLLITSMKVSASSLVISDSSCLTAFLRFLQTSSRLFHSSG